ncbi:uncharacterized protein LOC134226135 [Armigeres subalbatus]|uniref:uncharacterized protein LOC134226135 n=1 Tax=Armigeres subalbatus TaxID=124917 RepID=UPI002ED01D0C
MNAATPKWILRNFHTRKPRLPDQPMIPLWIQSERPRGQHQCILLCLPVINWVRIAITFSIALSSVGRVLVKQKQTPDPSSSKTCVWINATKNRNLRSAPNPKPIESGIKRERDIYGARYF